jgi:phosphatidylethanolamine/phosphatidyl-N-methylethanolamine N-methyltransferase
MKVADASMLREFVRAPMTIGAVAASGRPLARAAIAPVPAGADAVVVELGPGTGAMTGPVTERLAGRGRQLAIEVNERLAARLATEHPGVEVVAADAADLGAVLSDRGIARADVIVSGLPWAALGSQHQERLLDAVVDSLSPDGAFTTFAYVHSRWTPAARRLHRALEDRFEEVLVSRTVWRNVPPALVYCARRPMVRR